MDSNKLSQTPIYLDYMATTPVAESVQQAMLSCMGADTDFANPSSASHIYGWRAAERVKAATEQVAAFINADPKSIVWTSGTTEANNLALLGAAEFYQRQGKHIITVATEHKAVLDVCAELERRGFSVTYLQPQSDGRITPEQLAEAIQPDTILASIMLVNNEIGVIQDIAAVSQVLKAKGVLLHVDAAQAGAKIPIDVAELGVDLLSLSAHKMYGPKGIGVLYVRQKPRVRLVPQMFGGGQQNALRPGTLPTQNIVGMAAACELASAEMVEVVPRIANLRDALWDGIKDLSGVICNTPMQHSIAHNLNVTFAGIDGEVLLLALKDLALSSGSACNAASVEPSHVLMALGQTRLLATQAIRFSLGRETTQAEIDFAIEQVREQVLRLHKLLPS